MFVCFFSLVIFLVSLPTTQPPPSSAMEGSPYGRYQERDRGGDRYQPYYNRGGGGGYRGDRGTPRRDDRREYTPRSGGYNRRDERYRVQSSVQMLMVDAGGTMRMKTLRTG